jgi:surface antigen
VRGSSVRRDRRSYSAGGGKRLRGARFAAVVLGLSVLASGCSYRLGALTGAERKADKAATADTKEYTGSISPKKVAAAAPAAAALPPELDLAYAKAAAQEVLTRGGDDTSQPWENPSTGARGTVTPLAAAYTQDGFTCRDFLASYVREGAEAWLQGEACRIHQGKWEVKNLRPWKRT